MRDKNAIAMVGRTGVPHPSQRLSQRAARIRFLPTTHQIELIVEAVEYVALAPQNPDSLACLPISDRDVEVTAQYKVCTVPKRGDTVENAVHRADISAFTDRSVNAEHY